MKDSTKVFLWVIGVFLVASVVIALLVSGSAPSQGEYDLSGSNPKVAIVNLRGTIVSSRHIVSSLQELAENRSVKSIVLRVDSPGGGVAASQEIFEEVKSIRDTVKPIVVSMGSIAASGGYYVSCGATRIVANPGTITGSIGVIAMFPNYAKLMDKLGLKMDVIKSGKYKDSGSPFRKMTEADKKYFYGVVENSYDQFLNTVARQRKLAVDKLKKFADGRVFTGQQALKLGLVDTLGSLEDAISIAAKLGHIKGKPDVVQARSPRTLVDILLGDLLQKVPFFQKDFIEQPILQYRFAQ